MKKHFDSFAKALRDECEVEESSSSDSDAPNPPSRKKNVDRRLSSQRALFNNPKGKALAADLVSRRKKPPKRGRSFDSDDSDNPNPKTKKAKNLRRGLKISSPAAAAAANFEKGFPAALRVPLANSSRLSKAQRRLCGSDAVSDNGKILDNWQIVRRLDEQMAAINEVKAMVTILMRETNRGDATMNVRKSPKKGASSDCKIVACYRTPPSAPGSVSRRPTSPMPVPAVDAAVAVDAEEFLLWIAAAARGDAPATIRLPSSVVRTADVRWFDELMDASYGLRDEHMDMLIRWMAVKHDFERVQRNWTVLELWCWGPLTQAVFEDCAVELMPYVRGKYPLDIGRGWHTVDRVYGFGHLGKHWVGFEINLGRQCITVIDPLHLGRDEMSQYFEPMRTHIPLLCESGKVWEQKGITEPLKSPWDLFYEVENPHLNPRDKTNCGVLLMKSLEVMVLGAPFSRVSADRCSQYRLRYCVDLHGHSPLIPPRP